MSEVTRLSALDAAFLAAESSTTPMHVGSLSIFEGEPFHDESGQFRLDDVRALVAERLHLVPRFRQRVVEVPHGIGRPVWADDPAFDIDYHVRLVTLAPPGNDRQLHALCESQHMVLLDRAHPLWEFCFVDGLRGGRVGLIQKVHHAMVDGVSGVEVATALLDITPEPRRFEAPAWNPGALPAPTALTLAALGDMAAEPGRFLGAVARSVRHPLRTLGGFGRVGWAATTLLSRQTVAPPSSINRPVGHQRKFEVVRHTMVGIDEIRAEMGGTLNDVVLAAVTGGIRELLLRRGEDPGGRPLEALVPVSLRADDDNLKLGNKVAAMLVPLPVGEADPRARLALIKAAVGVRKQRHQAAVSVALLDTTNHWPAALAAVTAGLIHRQPLVNVVITNVPGPPFPLYASGARMLEAFPIVPLGGNLDVSVGILSYDGQLTIGLYADAGTCPDVVALAEGIEKSFFEMHLLIAA